MTTTYPPLKALCLLILAGLSATLTAQEEQTEAALNRELTLEREYTPSVQDANKVNTLPAVKEPAIAKMPIHYELLSLPAEPEREIGLLPPARIFSTMAYNNRRGYANLGLGSYSNVDGDAGYHILSTANTRLSAFFSHRSTNGKVKYIQGFMKDETVQAKINDNLGGLLLRHAFRSADLRLGGQYGYSAFNYYGMPSPTLYSISPSPLPDTRTNQVAQELSLDAGLASKDAYTLGYAFDLDFTRFSYKYAWDESMPGIAEHAAGAKLKLYTSFGADQQIGVATRFNYFFYTLPEASSSTFSNHLEGTLTPYYRVEGSWGSLQLGVNLMFVTDEGENPTRFFASPNAGVNIQAGEKNIVYLHAGGEIRSNSAFLLSRENRYIDPYLGVTPSRTWLDLTAGVRTGLIPDLWVNLFGQHKRTDDDAFFIPYMTPEGFGNVSRAMSFDSQFYRAGVELKYAYRKLFELSLKGVYTHWMEAKDDLDAFPGVAPKVQPYGRPTHELTAALTLRPLDKLALAFDYHLAAGRKVLLYGYNEEMKDINELNLTASYTLNNTFGVYLKTKNLLFQRYAEFYGYPLQNFSIMAGININF